jgi:hypothetical protein
MSTPQRSKLLHSVRRWKAKAIARRHENKALMKRILELTRNRDAWKAKAQSNPSQVTERQVMHHPEKKLPPTL